MIFLITKDLVSLIITTALLTYIYIFNKSSNYIIINNTISIVKHRFLNIYISAL